MKFGNGRLRVLLVLVGQANDGVWGRGMEDGGCDGAAALEDGLWAGEGTCQ